MNPTSVLLLTVEYIRIALHLVIWSNFIVSWIPSLRETQFGAIVQSLAGPIISPVRKLISKTPLGAPGMMFDFSLIAASLLIETLAVILRLIIILLFGYVR